MAKVLAPATRMVKRLLEYSLPVVPLVQKLKQLFEYVRPSRALILERVLDYRQPDAPASPC